MNSGGYIGIIVGILAFIVLKSSCIFYLWRRRSRKDKSRILNSTSSQGPAANTAELLAYLEKWEIRCDDVKIIKRPDGSDWELGCGAFGRVVKGLRGGVQEVAIKMLFQADHRAQESFLREISMLKFASRDRNVVQFYGVSLQNGIWLITEHMEGGDLRNALTKDGADRVTWRNKGKQIACDVAKGLAFLHSNKIIHRDLKSKNVLLTRDGEAKITDVGMAKLMSEAYFTQDASFGTFSWAAPEVLLGEKCSEKVDCYSLGVTCWEIATGLMPIRGHIHPPSEEECPVQVTQLIADLMARDPRARPSAAEAYRRLKACEPNPETVPLPKELSDLPSPPLSATNTQDAQNPLTWRSQAEHEGLEGKQAFTNDATLLELAGSASNRVTIIENNFMHVPMPGRRPTDPKEAAVLMQLAQGASTKLNRIDTESNEEPAANAGEQSPIFRPQGLRLSPEQALAIDAEEGLCGKPQVSKVGCDSDELM